MSNDNVASARGRGKRRQEVGVVSGNKMDKTVVVTVERIWSHPVYKKVVRTRAKFMAHDADNSCQPGDRVRLEECRPLSARKRWRVTEILERARGAAVAKAAE